VAFLDLGARRHQDEERKTCRTLGHILEERNEAVVSPVQILDHEHGWAVRRE